MTNHALERTNCGPHAINERVRLWIRRVSSQWNALIHAHALFPWYFSDELVRAEGFHEQPAALRNLRNDHDGLDTLVSFKVKRVHSTISGLPTAEAAESQNRVRSFAAAFFRRPLTGGEAWRLFWNRAARLEQHAMPVYGAGTMNSNQESAASS